MKKITWITPTFGFAGLIANIITASAFEGGAIGVGCTLFITISTMLMLLVAWLVEECLYVEQQKKERARRRAMRTNTIKLKGDYYERNK